MIWVALTALGLNLVTVATLATAIRSVTRQSARERDLLLDKLMHLAGRTWTPPPADPPYTPEPSERWTATPDQYETV